ncbi:MAG: ABC transporter substrate-binding protein, partial [Clostridia bacterium]
MKKVIAILLILAMFTGCSPGGKSEKKPETPAPAKTVRNTQFGVAYVEEENFDPIMTKNKVNLEMYGLVYEGLFELDENFAVKNLLCESYTNSGTSYKFKLKRGVTFSDGSPLTAGDVVFSIRRAMRPESFYAARLTNISGVYEDGGDVAVTLKRYNANLPRLLDIPVIKESSADTKVALGTGGYAVMLDTKTKTYYLAARSGWHQDKKLPYTRINMVKTAGIDQLIFNFESANIGIVTVDPTAPNPLQLRGEYETREYATTALVYLGFNTRRAPFGNSVVRQAIACAIDRKSAVELDFARMADETHLPIHSSCEAYDEGAARNFDYSTVNALAFLEKAAYKDENGDGKVDSGGKLSFEILVNAENKSRAALARRIASNLGDLGFTVSVREEK